MDWLWNWGGECFGYRVDDKLFAYHGVQAAAVLTVTKYMDQMDAISARLCQTIGSSLIGARKVIDILGSARYAVAVTLGMQTMRAMRCMADMRISRHLTNSGNERFSGVVDLWRLREINRIYLSTLTYPPLRH